MEKIRFAIIGCGRIAQRHAEIINNLASLTAVCDINESRAASLTQEYECNSYTDFRDLLSKENDIDIVSVCTPNGLHAEHTISSLKAGKHVVCEKPMAINATDCAEMIDEAEK